MHVKHTEFGFLHPLNAANLRVQWDKTGHLTMQKLLARLKLLIRLDFIRNRGCYVCSGAGDSLGYFLKNFCD
ncbi:hypothetical protein [Acinetobacter radioresistens]|uniref:hypothetical protein n=1 Tax=Acinetobacter radioresistens TaxID=40216 RepID=UPI00148ED7FD|nr:hypothetical protein [Acinetobacter radioresistens]